MRKMRPRAASSTNDEKINRVICYGQGQGRATPSASSTPFRSCKTALQGRACQEPCSALSRCFSARQPVPGRQKADGMRTSLPKDRQTAERADLNSERSDLNSRILPPQSGCKPSSRRKAEPVNQNVPKVVSRRPQLQTITQSNQLMQSFFISFFSASWKCISANHPGIQSVSSSFILIVVDG